MKATVKERIAGFRAAMDYVSNGSEVMGPQEGQGRAYWAMALDKRGRKLGGQSGPFETRHEAIQEALRFWPHAHSVSSGYGATGGFFDIRNDRNDRKESK